MVTLGWAGGRGGTGDAILSRPSHRGEVVFTLSLSNFSWSPSSALMSMLKLLLAELMLSRSTSGWGWVSVSLMSLFNISRHFFRISCKCGIKISRYLKHSATQYNTLG